MPQFGGFWVRFVAYLIDAILIYIVEVVIAMAMGFSLFGDAMMVSESDLTETMIMQQGLFTLIAFVLVVLYFALMESSSRQGTVGKIAMGLAVTDLNGERISFLRALGRYFAKFLSAIILGIGFLMVGWTQRKQGLHDMIAGTLVYKSRTPANLGSSATVFE